MPPMWEQKKRFKEEIKELILDYMRQRPDKVEELAEGACIRLAAKMTLTELAAWHAKLLLEQANRWGKPWKKQ